MEEVIYIRLRHKIQVRAHSKVTIGQISQVVAPEPLRKKIQQLQIHEVTMEDKNIIILDIMKVLSAVTQSISDVDIQTIGPSQVIVEVVYEKKKMSKPFFVLVWLLLFIGAALAIMNFHEDVSMRSVHKSLYKTLTGIEEEKPLLFQIPYSIGLGLGMILFFNHVFRKRINEEPSPLEVEMFNYQQDLDQYVIMHENKECMKHIDDH
ncbi:stage V sporulation protein AA [Bacillus sp. 2205SS5-2]|uniref:stage V sporulation protein AA n=1 Tax=Bacillus sp. 2205SS5-2 TaxID=3109031 RepID=UPI0030061092